MGPAGEPSEASARLWSVDVAAAAASLHDIERDEPRLTVAEHDRARRFADPGVARTWIAAHIALRLILEHVAGPGVRGMPFTLSARGKPELARSDLRFSLSHCGGRALIATSTAAAVGVDLERMRDVRMTADRRQAIVSAGQSLSGRALPIGDDARFLQAWVRLEAFAKASGEGIGPVLSRIGAFGPARRDVASYPAFVSGFSVVDIDVGEEQFASLAVAGGGAVESRPFHLPISGNQLRAFAAGADGR